MDRILLIFIGYFLNCSLFISYSYGQEDKDLVKLKPLKCSERAKLKSLVNDSPTFLRFRNKTNQIIYLYWINFEGEGELHSAIKPKLSNGKDIKPNWFHEGQDIFFVEEVMDWNTFMTHPWVLGSLDKCLGIYLPIKNPAIVVIKEGDLAVEPSSSKLPIYWAELKRAF